MRKVYVLFHFYLFFFLFFFVLCRVLSPLLPLLLLCYTHISAVALLSSIWTDFFSFNVHVIKWQKKDEKKHIKKKKRGKYVLFTRNAFEVGNYLWILIREAEHGSSRQWAQFSVSFTFFVILSHHFRSFCFSFIPSVFFTPFACRVCVWLLRLLAAFRTDFGIIPQCNMGPLCMGAGHWSKSHTFQDTKTAPAAERMRKKI